MHNLHAFTLIEMILAIGVASIALIAVNAVLFTSLRLRDTTADVVDAAAPMDQTVAFLRRDLECVVTPTNGTGKVLSGDFRVGDVNSPGVPEPVAIEMFTATGALGADAPWGDIQRVTYELRQPADRSAAGKDLIRSVARNVMDLTTPDVEDQFMLSGVAEHQVHLLRRHAMAGDLGHDQPDHGEHESAAGRPRGHPDGRKQRRDRATD